MPVIAFISAVISIVPVICFIIIEILLKKRKSDNGVVKDTAIVVDIDTEGYLHVFNIHIYI